MRHKYCTLLNTDYLSKGLALYQSLVDHCDNFSLWVLALDDDVYRSFISLPHVPYVVRPSDIMYEYDRVCDEFGDRTYAEWCWTLASVFSHHLLEMLDDRITYLDADLLFFKDPCIVFDEIGDASVAIVPHRFSTQYEHYEESAGTYNVSWVTFSPDEDGRRCCREWKEDVLAKCKLEETCGDQKYLNDWPSRYSGVCVLQNKGIGVAPWNIQDVVIADRDGQLYVDDEPIVFYHFHEYEDEDNWTNYPLGQGAELIYERYDEALRATRK